MSDEDRKMDHKVVFEPYDMDTALGTNNSGVLMFSPYLEDTDTVSSVIAGGDSGGSEAPVYNAQDSVLWNNIRDAFRSELVQMYRTLRASNGPWQYNAIEKRFEDHQSKWPEAIFNEDAWVKYIIPLVDPVTVDEETGELIRTDRYLTMLQGSKKEQRKWWLYNRLRYLDSKYDTGNASANIINIRFFNGGVLKLKTAIPMYAAVSFGGGTTPEIKRTEANTEVSFTYTPGTGVTEMETWIHSGNLITDVGDLSVFYPNECDFSKASLLRRLKIGDATAGYSNANLTTINVRNSPLLESIDCRNCPRLNITVNLENSPRLAEAYFDGTTITGLDLADGCAIETLHLPATVTALTLLNLTKLQEFYIPSYANVARLMMSNIDYEVINPVTVLESIHSNAQVNIQGLYLELDDAEAIGEFFDLLDTMTGVTRERSAVTGEWIYHDAEKAVVSGEVHTFSLTGEEMEALNSRYPYVRTTADHISTTLKYYNYDGSVLLESETILDGADGTYSGTPARADDADWRYTFIGWNTQPDKYVADADATKSVTRNRSVYAAYSRTSIAVLKYYTYDGSELLYSETIIGGGNGVWAGAPTRPSDPRYTYTFAGWSSVPNGQAEANIRTNVTTHKSVYAAYTAEGQKYTVTFVSESGAVLQTVNNVLYGGTVQFTGTVPAKTGVEDPEMYEFIGWDPSNTNIQGNTICYPVYKYNGIKFYRIIDKTIAGDYENSLPTEVRPYAFHACISLKTISLPAATSIGSTAFYNCYALQSISLPAATSIGMNAFQNCRALQSVSLQAVTNIGTYAFDNCTALQSISLPLVTSIASSAFNTCYALQSISLPLVTRIASSTFANCFALQSISIPLVTTIEYSAFVNCYALQSISLSAATTIFSNVFWNCTALQSVNLPAATYIGSNAFQYCSALQFISLPVVTSIGSSMFANCYALQSISLPLVTRIGSSAFLNCTALQSVNLPSATYIGYCAFISCTALQSISLPAATSIGSNAFCYCCNLRAVFLSGSSVVTLNHSNAFSSTHKWLSIYVPDSLVTAYQSANNWSYFSSRIFGITSYSGLPDGITVTNVSGDYSGNTEIFYINDSMVTSIGMSAFGYCYALQSISLPLVTTIDANAFVACYALQSINLPLVTGIWATAFYNCYALQSISLPVVTNIGANAFQYCRALQSISLPSATTIGQGAFMNCTALQSVNLPSATWIGSNAFQTCGALQSISLPAVASIEGTAFQNCFALQSINLPAASYIGAGAFQYCRALQSISLPSATYIGLGAFANCYALQSISIPLVTSIGESLFLNCSALKSISLPAATYIGGNAFCNCAALQSISLPAATYIGMSAFQYCYALQSISLPLVTTIDANAFSYCFALQSISLPLVTIIEASAFNTCRNLRAIFLSGSSVATLGASAFSLTHKFLSIFVPLSLVSEYRSASNWSEYSSRITGTVTSIGGNRYSNNTDVGFVYDSVATYIGQSAFRSCTALKYANLPSATYIGNYAFQKCTALQSVNLPSATSIGSNAFVNCTALQSISLPVVTNIGANAFYGCVALQSISLPSATTIGQGAFQSCNALQSVNLPAATSIGPSAFQTCGALQSISLPAVTDIGQNAFQYCHNLRVIFLSGSSVATLRVNALYSTHSALSIYVPDSLVTEYKSAQYWSSYSSCIVGHSQLPSE